MIQPNRDNQYTVLSGNGNILGAVNLLNILLDVEGFKKWIASYHGPHSAAGIFNGYMFGLRTLVRLLHQTIDFDLSLDLTEDFVLTRARSYGVPIVEIPNSCEKAILLRNIHKTSRNLVGSKSWVQLESRGKQFSDAILIPLRRLFSYTKLTLPGVTPDHETAVNFVSQWQLHLFLSDTRRGYPHGYHQPMLPDRLTEERLTKAFEGYRLAVQYLWYRLLGDEFAGSVAAEIHKATNWREFDKYYRPIQYELIDPKEKLTGLGWGFNTLLVAEATRLKWEEEASSLRALYRTIVEQMERMKYSESYACHVDTKANLTFSLTGLAAKIIVATTKNQRAWNVVNNIFDTEGHKKPFGMVMVCVGPKGLPDDATVISISQLARESNRPEPEIMSKLQGDGYLLVRKEVFSLLIDGLIGAVREGKLHLPISRDKLAEITGLNKPKPRIKVIEAE